MADVKIRNLDDQVVESYKLRARAAGRSLEAELREALSNQLGTERAQLLARLEQLRATLPVRPENAPNSAETLEDIRRAMAGERT